MIKNFVIDTIIIIIIIINNKYKGTNSASGTRSIYMFSCELESFTI